MGLRAPKNRIKEGKYTSGGEFVETTTNKPYQGYYCVLNDSFFIGKTFDPNASKLTPIPKKNKFFDKSKSLALYSSITGITSQMLQTPTINSIPTNKFSNQSFIDTKFYYKKVNEQPIIIKEIDENTYKSLITNSLYQVTFIGTYQGKTQSIDEAEKQLPGIKAFLGL